MQCKIFIFDRKDSDNRVATGIFKWMSNEIFDIPLKGESV